MAVCTDQNIKAAQVLSDKYFHFPQADVDLLDPYTHFRELKKGELLLKEGQVSKDIAFVDTGMLREFYYKDGRDITEHFANEGNGAISIESLFRQVPSRILIEALEPTRVILILYSKLVEMTAQSVALAAFHRNMLETSLIISQDKANSWRFETAKERYNRFLKEFPEAAKRASINHIASYLLMTPESLSRVRSGLL
jgi:CRP-like cAMP-binding protein